MHRQRASGILLHPTSLPGPHGIGDLGNEAYRFVDFLAASGQSVWQILPVGPTGYGNSPYSTISAFAGNPLLISLERLVEAGDLEASDLAETAISEGRVNYRFAHGFKERLLHKAARRFRENADRQRQTSLTAFCGEHSGWLDDFVLFEALRKKQNDRSWTRWPEDLRRRDPQALDFWRLELAEAIFCRQYSQFVFFEQWFALKEYANRRGVRILGDLPIFVALDSADVWSAPENYYLDSERQPTLVAGVPPDYFSETGQRWGNPLYRWDRMIEQDFSWWRSRLRWALKQTDLLRVDHFRGFEACWAIPAAEKTAINGSWMPVPGAELFQTLLEEWGKLPLVAEDLGVITPKVEALRDRFDFPGMKILQFAFDSGPDNPYLPHNLSRRCVIYTGTHDNDTTLGWWQSLPEKHRLKVRAYLGRKSPDMPGDLVHLAMTSVADLCITPLQDLLGLDSEARMNRPGRPDDNWCWRFLPGALDDTLQQNFAELTELSGRGAP